MSEAMGYHIAALLCMVLANQSKDWWKIFWEVCAIVYMVFSLLGTATIQGFIAGFLGS